VYGCVDVDVCMCGGGLVLIDTSMFLPHGFPRVFSLSVMKDWRIHSISSTVAYCLLGGLNTLRRTSEVNIREI